MRSLHRGFFQFSAAHSFLIGLLPFFIPILLWQQNLEIKTLSAFIALSGSGFLAALWLWQKLYQRHHWHAIFGLAFLFELTLIGLLIDGRENGYSPILLTFSAIISGAYGCFYWTTQRVLFSHISEKKHTHQPAGTSITGRQFGNFQILVIILLKLGIFVGAFLLEQGHTLLLFSAAAFISITCWFWFYHLIATGVFREVHRSELNPKETTEQPSSLVDKQSFFYNNDGHHSTPTFYLDGIFLFLESYFWVLSLFLISQQNIMELGLLIITLTLCLSVLFALIKNRIDHFPKQRVYALAVVGYALSWLLRGTMDGTDQGVGLYSMILLIAFLTAFFRLSFNKRFFDHAHKELTLPYLLSKSRLSQFSLVIFYGGLAAWIQISATSVSLSTLYYAVTPLALLYILYRACNQQKTPDLNIYKKVSNA